VTKARSKAVRGGPRAREMATRRRSSVSFQLHENQFLLHLPQTATTHGPQVGTAASRIRRALPLPLLAFGLGMAAMVSQGDKAGSTASRWSSTPGHEKMHSLLTLAHLILSLRPCTGRMGVGGACLCVRRARALQGQQS